MSAIHISATGARNTLHQREAPAGGPRDLEYRAVAADGRELWLRLIVDVTRDTSGKPVQLRGLAIDITDRKQAEEALRTSEKLAATGRLAASIAHEINNPMASVTNLLYLLQQQPGLPPAAQQYASMAQDEMSRVAHITRQMLAFYRDSTAPVLVNFAELLDTAFELYVRRLHEKSITVERRYDDVPPAHAFPGEMRQVVSNLLLNAVEAVAEGGRITVHVTGSRDWSDLRRKGLRINFIDDGNGIQPENLHRIFEPFFTTKGENGTGLGFWVTQGIVRKHGGSIRVYSSTHQRHHGTCFSIFLPADAQISEAWADDSPGALSARAAS